MPKRMTVSQYNNYVRKLQREQKKAIDNYNRQVKDYNKKVKKSVDDYNREVNAYNQRVKSNRRRLQTELNKLSRISTTSRYTVYQSSVVTLNTYYEYLDQKSGHGNLSERYNRYVDLSEREAANSAEVFNALVDSEQYDLDSGLNTSTITSELNRISLDLHSRWQGAIFSLNPRNPDAARHFCTSAREIITQILEIKAPDSHVISLLPDCDLTDNGKPTRRSKIRFLLSQKNLLDNDFENFVEEDMSNIIELFRLFNDGTHGSSGTFSLTQLSKIKKRVEDGIIFLSEIAN
ncbi:hypothetical protein [Muricauda sp. MAR_2010_75]|uniref:pPIWI-associating nuclease domain-containing protein n=1 Tax=Allomuricauda sp. MAR_2010_75 TaxID=1250232 RepID=UPI0005689C73|nr:hypothetical protein [Muricauda sp. MAR_2010_75]